MVLLILLHIHRAGQYLKTRGHNEIFSATSFLQLHFNSFSDAHFFPDEVTLSNKEKTVLSPVWCDFIRDKESIREGVEVQLQKQSCTENRIVAPSLYTHDYAVLFKDCTTATQYSYCLWAVLLLHSIAVLLLH